MIKENQSVVLNSGGPTMTTVKKDDEGNWECIWFDGKEKKSDKFPEGTIKPRFI
jgi:uncharacterized protein YodC (DUF2158 family)